MAVYPEGTILRTTLSELLIIFVSVFFVAAFTGNAQAEPSAPKARLLKQACFVLNHTLQAKGVVTAKLGNLSKNLGYQVHSGWACKNWEESSITAGAVGTMKIDEINKGIGMYPNEEFRDPPVRNVSLAFQFGQGRKKSTRLSGMLKSSKWDGRVWSKTRGHRYNCTMEATDLYGFQVSVAMRCTPVP